MNQPAADVTDAVDTRLIEHLPYDTDGGIARRAAIGLIVLATDYTIEHEWRQLFGAVDGVALYQSRIHNEDRITPETLRAMEPRLVESARLITPDTPVDVMAYGCTSASMAIGEDKVFERIREAKPGVRCTTPITASFRVMRAPGRSRSRIIWSWLAKAWDWQGQTGSRN